MRPIITVESNLISSSNERPNNFLKEQGIGIGMTFNRTKLIASKQTQGYQKWNGPSRQTEDSKYSKISGIKKYYLKHLTSLWKMSFDTEIKKS